MGSIVEAIDEELENLPLEDVQVLLHLADKALDVLEHDTKEIYVEANLPSSIPDMRSKYFRSFNNLTKNLESGKISLSDFDKRAHDMISDNFRKSYQAGLGKSKKIDAGGEEFLRRATNEEMKYARKFGRDIKSGNLRMPRTRRAGMYANTLNSMAWHAKVESQPDTVSIEWKLGVAEHCIDCIILASNSPYTKWNLPTVPRAGNTRCHSNCKCKIRFRYGVLSKSEIEDAQLYTTQKNQTLKDMVSKPRIPPGMKHPSLDQQLHIDELRNNINYLRREIGSGKHTGKDLKDLIIKRSEVNKELIDFTKQNNIYEVPAWSVDDILDERNIGKKAVDGLFLEGLDGATMDVAGKSLGNSISRYVNQIDDNWSLEKIRKILDDV